ncbi:hypothetical protein BV898_11171 [Hypsibius exemplaris]|uniref:Uncharacterized protein n=1 Tax=Hypsibius exemplaris TaxID=2072580 RepID=A0A1W0WHI4_HYPEX|nr:hypothetical protein BV898_11171 [Hypsibius exemplaris]
MGIPEKFWIHGICGVILVGTALGLSIPAAGKAKIHVSTTSKPFSAGPKNAPKTTEVPVKAPPKPWFSDLNDTTTGNHTSQSVELNVPFLAAQHRSGSGGGQQQNNMLPMMMMMMNQNNAAAAGGGGGGGRADGGGGGGGGGGGVNPAMMAMMMSMMQQNNNQGSG